MRTNKAEGIMRVVSNKSHDSACTYLLKWEITVGSRYTIRGCYFHWIVQYCHNLCSRAIRDVLRVAGTWRRLLRPRSDPAHARSAASPHYVPMFILYATRGDIGVTYQKITPIIYFFSKSSMYCVLIYSLHAKFGNVKRLKWKLNWQMFFFTPTRLQSTSLN